MTAKLTPNMIKSLENLAKAHEGTVPEYGTLAMNKLGCTANGLEALMRRGLVELFETGAMRLSSNGRQIRPRAYRLTEAGKAKIIELNSASTEQTAAREARSRILNVLILGGMDVNEAAGLLNKIADAEWSAGYGSGYAKGKAQYNH